MRIFLVFYERKLIFHIWLYLFFSVFCVVLIDLGDVLRRDIIARIQ